MKNRKFEGVRILIGKYGLGFRVWVLGCSLFTCERTKGVFGVWTCVRVSSSHCCNLHSYSENLFCRVPWT